MDIAKFAFIILGVTILLVGGQPASAQQVGGTDDKGGIVVLTARYGGEKKPERKEINVGADPFCRQVYQAKNMVGPLNEKWVWGKNNTLANVFVKVEKGLGDRQFTPPKKAVRVEQVECVYVPHVVGAMTNQNLSVVNRDQTLHSLNAAGLAWIGPGVGQPVAGMEITYPLPKREDVLFLKCDVHAWMNSYVHVVAHPFFAVTGDDGTCTIKGLPAGEYELTVWHEFKTFVPDNATIKVTVKEGEAAKATVTYAPKKAG